MDDYRVEVCLVLRQLERLDKEQLTEDERADAEEVRSICYHHSYNFAMVTYISYTNKDKIMKRNNTDSIINNYYFLCKNLRAKYAPMRNTRPNPTKIKRFQYQRIGILT